MNSNVPFALKIEVSSQSVILLDLMRFRILAPKNTDIYIHTYIKKRKEQRETER